MQEEPAQPYGNYNPTDYSSPPPPPPKKRSKGKEGLKSVLSTLSILLLAPAVAILLTTYVFQSYEVDGPSMEETLHDGDRLIVWKAPRTIADITDNNYIPERGDIIIFNQVESSGFGSSGQKQLIKRVIGLPGERVVINKKVVKVYNNDNPDGFIPDITLGYSEEPIDTSSDIDQVIPEGSVFVLGDNRANSLDSRLFGPIDTDNIVGKLVFRLFPVNQARSF